MSDRAEAPLRKHARIAGFAYVFIIVIAMVSVGAIDAQLVVPGDDAATAQNIFANQALFRVSAASVMVMYAAVIVLSGALFEVSFGLWLLFKGVNAEGAAPGSP